MCGLYGVIRVGGLSEADRRVFAGLGEHLRHRGPDGTGLIELPHALLGMHRLSIMDVEHGWQPFWSEDGQIGVLGNGEIYNAHSLAAGLTDRGHVLRTGSDIEVVPHLYEEAGTSSFAQLRGMFALVILDKRAGRVTLVRDRLGEKPICYTRAGGGFAFASEQRALVKAGAVAPEIDRTVLPDYLLHGFTPEPHSLIQGVMKVPAGSFLQVDLETGAVEIEQFWNIRDALADEHVTTAQLRKGIEEAVEECCQSDVPVGVALSGGLDSSMVAMLAQRFRPDVQAFSIGYHGAKSDESELARGFASELGIPITVAHLGEREVGEAFGQVCEWRDEPIADIAGPSIDAVSRTARQANVPVLLTGLGGDELFWGYDWVRRLGAYSFGQLSDGAGRPSQYGLRQSRPVGSAAGLAQWLETRGGRKSERDVDAFITRWGTSGSIPLPLYEFQVGYPSIIGAIVELCALEGVYPVPTNYIPRDSRLVAGYYAEAISDTYLRVNGLAQTDRLSMRHSIEARTPLVDYRLTELVMSGRMAGDGSLSQPNKAELRAVARQVLPPHVTSRPKQGFTPPVRNWLSEIWRSNKEALGSDSALASSGVLQSDALIRQMSRPILRTGRVNQLALRLATLELWFRGLHGARLGT